MAGLANMGGSAGWDVPMKIANEVTTTAFAATTTSQFKVVYANPLTSTTEDLSADYMVTTTMIPVGVIQNYVTSSTDMINVRVAGITKVFALDSIPAFTYVTHAGVTAGAATTTAGYVTYFTPHLSFTGTSVTSKRILGLALQGAQKTGAAISILLLPQIAY